MTQALTLIGQRSASRIAPFLLHHPRTVDEALECMRSAGGQGVYMAGGLDLVNRMKHGAAADHVIHLGRVASLSAIEDTGGAVRIGAAVTHHALACSPAVRARAPALAAAWRTLANPRVRHQGTLGGNLMAREPTYDAAPILMALGATLNVATIGGVCRQVPATELPEADGLLVSVEVAAGADVELRLDRSLRPAVTVALSLSRAGGLIVAGRVAVGCAYASARSWPLGLARPIAPAELPGRAAEITAALLRELPQTLDDRHGSAAYRSRMTGVLVRRLLARGES